MLALRKLGPAPGVALVDVVEPEISGPDDVKIEVTAAGICGSDLHIDHWAPGYHHLGPSLPLTLGHEFVGRVVARGSSGPGPAVGSRVTVVPATTCGRCAACAAAEFDACRERRGIGVMRDGGFARHVVVPARNCIAIPDGLPDEVAALTEPVAIGVNAVMTAALKAGEKVVVFGPGTIGQAIAVEARRAGADVTVVGFRDERRIAVLRSLGFANLIDLGDPAQAATLAALADTVDCVFEASGAASAFKAAPGLLRPKGRLVVVGIHAVPGEIDLVRLVRKRLQVLGSFSSPGAIWPDVVRRLAADPETYAKFVTHRYSLENALAGFDVGHRREASKVIVRPG
jgi:threonine 3-dehydrogenase